MTPTLRRLGLSLACLTLAACATEPEPPSLEAPRTRPATQRAGGDRSAGEVERVFARDLPPPARGAYTLEAMVGQINGEPLYAKEALEPIASQLKALARNPEVSREQFRNRARKLVRSRLRQLVADRLLLGEARRELTKRERRGLERHMKKRREELIRKWGEGSRSIADQRLREETGKGLEATLKEERRRALIQRHLRNELKPRMDVSRREVERYYRRHREKYNPPARRTIRLIRVKSAKKAKRVKAALEAGTPFAKVASDPELNNYKPDKSGLFGKNLEGKSIFRKDAINKAIRRLEEGEHAGPFKLGGARVWVQVASLKRPEGKSLKEVQLKIERKLRQQRYRKLTQQYRKRLFEQGSYRRIKAMADTLLRVAVARYLGPPPESG